MKFLNVLIINIFLISFGHSSSVLKYDGNIYRHINSYIKLHKEFSKKFCSNGEEGKFYKLLRSYRGNGNYIPQLLNNNVDKQTIREYLPLLSSKIRFIDSNIKKLKNLKKMPRYKNTIKDVNELISELLDIKKSYNFEVKDIKKQKLKNLSIAKLISLREAYDELIENIFYLKNFRYPNDHLKNRMTYDQFKGATSYKGQRAANRAFFYRKIVEDGALDKNLTHPDKFLRTTIDTIKLEFKKNTTFISEDLRNDLSWMTLKLKRYLKMKKRKHIERLTEWRSRTENKKNFYEELIDKKNRKRTAEIIKNKNKAMSELKDYVYGKQAEVYLYWLKQSEINKALYSLETILFNEVGRVDGKDGLERKDVVQVVLNRMNMPFYHSLSKKQDIYKILLSSKTNDEIQKEHWLNVLFRVGEFSFTYYYISGSVKTFCPDMSRLGTNLRRVNLKIALKGMNNFRTDFPAVRYFSRASMLGRINMGSVWTDYKIYPERAGYIASNQLKLKQQYSSGKYDYYYHFTDPSGVRFEVVNISNTVYSVSFKRGRPVFYKYRTPHYFKYFVKN